MNAVRKFIWGPTMHEQQTEAARLVRKNRRQLEDQKKTLEGSVKKAKLDMKKMLTNPNTTAEQRRRLRILAAPVALEIVRSRKQQDRLQIQMTQLDSVGMQIKEAYTMRKIQASMKTSVPIMRDVNKLVKIPELNTTMQELSRQLVASGIIEEMVGDMMPDEEIYEDEAAEAEIDRVIVELLGIKPRAEDEPTFALPEAPKLPTAAEEEDEEANMLDMQTRLEALKS